MDGKVEELAGVLERAGYPRSEAYRLALVLATPTAVPDDEVDLGREPRPDEDVVSRRWEAWVTPTVILAQ